MSEVSATRSAALALADERTLMQQGYAFLDEKRILLASEMLRRLKLHQALQADLDARMREARKAMRAAVLRHGFEALQVAPARENSGLSLKVTPLPFLGVSLIAVEAEAMEPPPQPVRPAVDPSEPLEALGASFAVLLPLIVELAREAENLERLAREYRRTERRAKSLENVLLPEIRQQLRAIEEHLEAADQEEAIRVRMAGMHR